MSEKVLRKPTEKIGDDVHIRLVQAMKERMLPLDDNNAQLGSAMTTLTVGQGKMCSVSSCL